MQIALTPEQEALRAELREYFAALVTPERRAALAASTSDFKPGEDGGRTAARTGASSATRGSTRTSSVRSGMTAGWASAGPRSGAARTAR